MKIRQMAIDDYEEVYQIWLHTPGMGLNNLDDSRAGIEKYLKRNPTTSFVAEDKGKIIGVILGGHDGRRGVIHHTVVLPQYQKQGVGTLLVEHVMSALKEEGIHKAVLVAFAKNENGNAFWKKIGFTDRPDLIYRNRCIDEMIRIDT